MHKSEKFIEEKIIEISKRKNVVDMGGGQRFQKWLSKYESLFDDSDYKTFDCDVNSGADIVGDIHQIPLKDESVDAIICASVLEHVENPIIASGELYRVLKKGGVIYMSLPSLYPYHARKGVYKDYWRFFDDTIEMLFKDYSKMEYIKEGGYFNMLNTCNPLPSGIKKSLRPLSLFMDKMFNTEAKTTTSFYHIYAVK